MKYLLIVGIALSLMQLTGCAGNIKPSEKNKQVMPAFPLKCGNTTFDYGVVQTSGNKDRVDGFFIKKRPDEALYLMDIKPSTKMVSKLKGKRVIVLGEYHSIHVGGVIHPNPGHRSHSFVQGTLHGTQLFQVMEAGDKINVKALNKKCEQLKQATK